MTVTDEDREAEIERLQAEIARLQRVIDSRPAINAALPESYIKWSQSIYVMEYHRAITGTHIHVSSKHLWKYAKEAEFRFNRRSCPETMFSDLISDFGQGSSK